MRAGFKRVTILSDCRLCVSEFATERRKNFSKYFREKKTPYRSLERTPPDTRDIIYGDSYGPWSDVYYVPCKCCTALDVHHVTLYVRRRVRGSISEATTSSPRFVAIYARMRTVVSRLSCRRRLNRAQKNATRFAVSGWRVGIFLSRRLFFVDSLRNDSLSLKINSCAF
ncbi:hypothetical protein PUN28_010582 [Cardiocondyla obscurior]|uniref:Uncharacterized protein n=1 Tax=Cardiocondyla obscurior TaxID=286306 RepID=A0AAW2FJ99_9HYME